MERRLYSLSTQYLRLWSYDIAETCWTVPSHTINVSSAIGKELNHNAVYENDMVVFKE